jgi:virginiamycin B lyase
MSRDSPPSRPKSCPVVGAPMSALLVFVTALLVFAASAPAYPPPVKTQLFPLAEGLDPVRAYSLAFGSEEELWFAGTGDELIEDPSTYTRYGAPIGLIGHVSTDGQVVEIPLGRLPGSGVGSITSGPDGAMWFTLGAGDAIGRITTDGTITRFPLPHGRRPGAIVAAPDGNLWFTEPGAGAIGRMTPTGELREFTFGARGATSGIAVGPDGNLWFTLTDSSRIGRLTPAGERAVFKLPKGVRPGAIVATAAGLWFTERPSPGHKRPPKVRIGHLSVHGRFRQVTVPSRTPVVALAADAEGTVWYATTRPLSAIGSISPGGGLSRLSCVSAECTFPPVALTVAPDGRLWFATGSGECRICGGGSAIAQEYEPGYVGHLSPG